MTSVLVTGASGFIGRRLVPALQAAGQEVWTMNSSDGDVADRATWASQPRCDVVVHLAGRSFVPDSWIDPAAFIRTNVTGTAEALDYCRARGARLVFLSSYLYGHSRQRPIPESGPLSATNPYALSKLLSEQACRFHAERLGVPVTVLRLFNVYGPGQAASFLIPCILRQLATGGPIHVRDLEPRRDYVYVDDVVEAVVRAAVHRNSGFGVFNLGTGVSHSVSEVIEAVQEVWQTRRPVHSEERRRQDEVMDAVADVTAARETLHWRPRFGLRDGLAALRRDAI